MLSNLYIAFRFVQLILDYLQKVHLSDIDMVIFETGIGYKNCCNLEVSIACLNCMPFYSFSLRTLSGVPLISFRSRKKFSSFILRTWSKFLIIAFPVRMMLITSCDRASLFPQRLKNDSTFHAAFMIGSPRFLWVRE